MLDKILDVLKNGNNNILYKIGNKEITYIEAFNKVVLIANNLKKQGNAPVILYGHKSINQFISILACVVAKRCYIPIDLCTPPKRVKEIIELSNATLLIKNENINIENIEVLTLDELNNKYENSKESYDVNNNNAYIIFTSGSTGNPKGVPISYDNLNNFISWVIKLNEFNDCKYLKILSEASFSFDLSLMDIYFSIYTNSSIIAIDGDTKENINMTLEVIKNNKIEFLIMTPTFIKMLLIDYDFNSINYENIKYMFFCGECLEVETVKKIKERFPNVKVINAYGPTEATCFVSLIDISDDMLNNNVLPVGKIDGAAVDIYIANNEIILKGASVFSGYLGNNSSNCFKIDNINCYRTGDIGYIDNNYLYCSGRIDNQIKYQGYRIELADIENNLLKINGVTAACVIAKYKEKSNIVRLIKAFVTVNNNISEDDIKQELDKIVPHYMIPTRILFEPTFPLNKSEKVDRNALKTKLQ